MDAQTCVRFELKQTIGVAYSNLGSVSKKSINILLWVILHRKKVGGSLQGCEPVRGAILAFKGHPYIIFFVFHFSPESSSAKTQN